MTVETTDVGAAAPASEAVVSAAVADTPADTASPSAFAPEPKDIDKDLMAVWNKHNPRRDEGGKFTKAEEAPAETAKEPGAEIAAEPETPAVQPKETAEVKPATPAIDPPHSWPAEAKPLWASVSPEAQKVIAKREADAHAEITRRGEQAKTYEETLKAYEPLGQLIQAHKDDFSRRGISPVQSFSALLAAQKSLDENPVHGLVQIGLSYGVDLRPLLQGQPATIPAAPDPRVAQLEARLQQVTGYLTEQQRTQHDAAEKQRLAQESELQQVIGDFAKDKPHFNEVKPVMAALLQSEQAKDLAEAYDMAINAKPDIRQRIQEDQRKADEAKREADAKAKAEQARKAASVNVKSSSANASPRTMDDTLKEIARKTYGAAD